MTPQDNRLADGAPMRPVSCRRCGGGVLVRKSSWHQTSVQWSAQAERDCAERRPAGRAVTPAGGFETCHALAATIRDAALNGTVEVLDEDGN